MKVEWTNKDVLTQSDTTGQSKAILVIDKMPNSCDECEVRCGGYTAKEYFEKSIKRPSWCPLKPMPEKNTWDITKNGHVTEYAEGWNACLEELVE